jgi:hypothetical protein
MINVNNKVINVLFSIEKEKLACGARLSHLSNIADSIALNLKNTNLTVERMKY